MRKDYNEIDSVRMVCNFLVVVIHSWAAGQYVLELGFEYRFWDFVCNQIAAILLPALFLLSGYLLFKNYSFLTYGTKLKSRLKRLVVPYLVWNLIFVGIYLASATFVSRLKMRVNAFQLDTLGGCLDKVCSLTAHPIDGPLWFMRTLFIFTLVSPFLYLCLKRLNKWILMTGGVFLLLLLCVYPSSWEILRSTYPIYSLIAFMIGGYCAMYEINLVTCFRPQKWLWLVLGCVVDW